MREIKFRGLRTDGKGWVYGVPYYIAGERKCFIIDNCQSGNLTQEDSIFQGKEVEYKSIGQLWKPSLGIQVYGGDLVSAICAPSGVKKTERRKCKIIDSDKGFDIAVWHNDEWWAYSSIDFSSIEIIGNIHEREVINE